MSDPFQVAVLDVAAATKAIDQLAEVLVDCVAGGASVSFMSPFSHRDAVEYFRKVITSVGNGETVLVAAVIDGRIVGTAQLGLDTPPNQPHRADVKKMLTHRSARRRGVGAAMLARVEAEAKKRSRTVLVLDTANAEAERLYARAGWQRVGVIPDYALWPDGGLCATTLFWKRV
jgi:GNAT superfamily N-acetyltransferase